MSHPPLRALLAIALLTLLPRCTLLRPGPPPFDPPPLAIHADVAGLDWMVGRWRSDDGRAEETWLPAGDSLFGVSYVVEGDRTVEWEALIIGRDRDGKLVYRAMPRDRGAISFEHAKSADRGARFSNPSHDFPKHIAYVRRDDPPISRMTVRLVGDGPDAELPMLLVPLSPAPPLEDADRRFAADVARRGLEAWVDVFLPDGAMIHGAERIAGKAAVREFMRPVLTNPAERLRWAPIASGLSPAGDLGHTFGAWVSEKRSDDGATWAEASRGAYVTIWKQNAAGQWQVLFDTGDPASSS